MKVSTHFPANPDIADLLNSAVDAYCSDKDAKSASYHGSRDLRFYIFDRYTVDGIQTADSPKPDLAGVHFRGSRVKRSSSAHDRLERLYFREFAIYVEVKEDWPAMQIQAATYARADKIANKSKLWTLVIAINQREASVRFNFFHRGGLTSSHLCELRERGGLEAFAHIMT